MYDADAMCLDPRENAGCGFLCPDGSCEIEGEECQYYMPRYPLPPLREVKNEN